MKIYIRYLVLLSGIFLSLHCVAQESILDDTLKLEEIIVTGSKLAISRDNIPLTISVVREEEIASSSESALLPVLSEQVPGIFITERGITGFGVATGSAGQISVRGIGGSPTTQVLVLLNGNPQFMGIMGHPLADAYVASDVDRVEVIRGPASTLYGSNAMGGVINIITHEKKEDGLNANARAMYGAYNTMKLMANGGMKHKNLDITAGINYDKTDGHRDSSDFSIITGYLQAGYQLGTHFKIRGDLSLADFEAQDPGMVGENAGERIDILRGMGSIVLDNNYEHHSGSVRFFYNFGEHTISDGFHSRDNCYGLIAYQSINAFPGNSLTVGMDYKNYGGMAENTKAMMGNGIQFVDTSLYELAGYAQMQQELFRKLVVNAGFRLDYNNVVGAEPVPTFGLAYKPAYYLTLRGSVSKGFRYPTIRELFMWDIANRDLDPEKLINYEVGMLGRLLNDRVSIELTLFVVDGDNLIKSIIDQGVPQYQNSGAFFNQGIEFGGRFSVNSSLSFMANYSYIHMDTPLLATPEHQLFISGNYSWKRLHFMLSWQSVAGLYTMTDPVATSDYNLIDTRIAYQFNDFFDAFLKIENLLNQEYEINYGYPMPGIVWFVGANFHLN